MKKNHEKFKNFLSVKYPKSDITAPYSIEGDIYIRFELGDELKNGTKKRVKQVVKRAAKIFNEVFYNEADRLWVIYYEYPDNTFESYENNRTFLSSLINDSSTGAFEIKEGEIQNGYYKTDEKRNRVPETQKVEIGVGLFNQNEFDFKGLIVGLANLEMGFDPKIPQTVMVFNPNSGIGFYMYDDRGCYVWSDNRESIQDLYESFNEWIVDFDRENIDNFFKF